MLLPWGNRQDLVGVFLVISSTYTFPPLPCGGSWILEASDSVSMLEQLGLRRASANRESERGVGFGEIVCETTSLRRPSRFPSRCCRDSGNCFLLKH